MVNVLEIGYDEIINRSRKKSIYCFGAGKIFTKFIKKYSYDFKGVIDTYKSKNAQSINIDSKEYDIISPEMFAKNYDGTQEVIITCAKSLEIVHYLNSIPEIDGMNCYIAELMPYYTSHSEIYPISKCQEQKIPKRIHYCWFGHTPLPKLTTDCIKSWKKHCPDYEIILWNEDNYDVNKNEFVKNAYNNKMWAFVSDYVRVDVVYKYGGIYLDTDVELIKSLDELIYWDFYCGFENSQYVAWGLGYGAMKGHPILKDVLDYYENNSFLDENNNFKKIACPIIQSDILKQYGFEINGKNQTKDNMVIYAKEFFSPYSFFDGIGRITANTYSIHHYHASWLSDKEKENKYKYKKLFVKNIRK